MKLAWPTIALSALIATCALAEEDAVVLQSREGQPGPLDPSLRNEAKAAIDRGVKWLAAKQQEDGYWSNQDFPALTALPLWALVRGGYKDTDSLTKAKDYLLSCVHEDGSIFREAKEAIKGGGLSSYNTALCMVALHELGDPTLNPVILKARQFMAKNQHLGGDMYRGGFGYDPGTGRPYADLSNSYIAYEAMRLTEAVEDFRAGGEGRADLDWQAAVEFLDRVQNRGSEKNEWASDDPKEKGGFIYRPDASQAGTFTESNGVVRFRTYASMTYAGLLSLIYAKVDRNDERVRSAFDWALNHWTLQVNPGMGQDGLYYFYNVLSKCLAAYGRDQLHQPDGRVINWRAELVKKLLDVQKIDPETGNGYWVNDAGRWWEADPVLVTSYSLLALEVALQGAE